LSAEQQSSVLEAKYRLLFLNLLLSLGLKSDKFGTIEYFDCALLKRGFAKPEADEFSGAGNAVQRLSRMVN
jgi:hypothetical protein